MIKSNVNKDMIKFQISEKQKIFTIDSTYHVAESIGDFWELENSIWLETGLSNYQKAYLVFTEYENGILNIRYSQKQWRNNRFADKYYQVFSKRKINFRKENDNFILDLKNNNKIIVCKKPFSLKILDKNNKIITETNNRKGYEYLENFIAPPLGFKQIKDDIKNPFMSLDLKSDELIYGLGEKYKPLVKNGIEATIFNVDPSNTCNHDLSYGGVPFLISNKNWGMLLNTGYKSTFEIGSPVTDGISFTNNEEYIDMYWFLGNDMKDIINLYTELTGKITGVPDDAYGIWMNRLYYHNYDELFTEIDNSIKHDYPLDVITLDPKWIKNRYTKTCNFEFNDEAFGDFKTMINDVHSKGKKMCFWINPYFQVDNTPKSDFVVKSGYLVKSSNENEAFAHPWSGIDKHIEGAGMIDFSNPAAFQWYKDQIKYLLENGVDFIKPDYGDGLPKEAIMHNGLRGEEFKQHYIELYLKASYEATQEFYGKTKGFVLSRPAFIGTQKYVGKWSGDASSSFSELKIHLMAGLSLSLSGNVMWGTDIGGFHQSHKKEKDLYSRWTQLGMFTPFSRYHGIGPREPWYFSKEELEISKKYALIKKQMLPYYKMCELESVKTGVPIMRPLVLNYQNDILASKIDDQFMIGNSIMVAPILADGVYNRQVYLPEGNWINFFDNSKKYEGNKSYFMDCKIDEILVFIKDNSILPMFENGSYHFDNLKNSKLEIKVFGKPTKKEFEFLINSKKVLVKSENENWVVDSDFETSIVTN